MYEGFGLIGMICIVAAWIPQTLRTIRTKRVGMEPKFLWLYFFGCIGLVIYSAYIQDAIFVGLNGISFFLNLINVYYHYRYNSNRKKGAKWFSFLNRP